MTGTQVKSRDGRSLGEVTDVFLDMDAGRVAYALLSLGGRKLFPVPWKILRLRPAENAVVLDVDVDRIAGAPSFDRETWPDLLDRSWGSEIHDYYGVTEYWN